MRRILMATLLSTVLCLSACSSMTQQDVSDLRLLLTNVIAGGEVADAELTARLDRYSDKLEKTEGYLRMTEQAVVLIKDEVSKVSTGAVTPTQGGIGLITGLIGLWVARNQTRKKALARTAAPPPGPA